MRIQASLGIADIAERDGHRSARLHATNPPADDDGASDRICANVPLPDDTVIVSGGALKPDAVVCVQTIRWRSESWRAKTSRLVLLAGERFATPIMASPWVPGPWDGDAVLSQDFDPALPTEANPA